jgi:hypothetical protein
MDIEGKAFCVFCESQRVVRPQPTINGNYAHVVARTGHQMYVDPDIHSACLPASIYRDNDRIDSVISALRNLVEVIEAAGLLNLSNGVQLGPTVWYVKASDAIDYAKRALSEVD